MRPDFPNQLITVTGPIAPLSGGIMLPHEHIMSTFGQAAARYPQYDQQSLLARVIPYLTQLRQLGCQTIADCTCAYFGRHPELLRLISQESGMQILTNTGYYGAAGNRYIPPHAYRETADIIASRWVREFAEGIDGTEIYPGFIKTAVDFGPLSSLAEKLLTAAARAHLKTGMTIQTHCGSQPTIAMHILELLKSEGVHSSAWIWVHAHQVENLGMLLPAAQAGAWISLDNLHDDNAEHVFALLQGLKSYNLLARVLLSHDGDLWCDGEFRPCEYLFTNFIPKLQSAGFTSAEIEQLIQTNPQRAYTIQVRESLTN